MLAGGRSDSCLGLLLSLRSGRSGLVVLGRLLLLLVSLERRLGRSLARSGLLGLRLGRGRSTEERVDALAVLGRETGLTAELVARVAAERGGLVVAGRGEVSVRSRGLGGGRLSGGRGGGGGSRGGRRRLSRVGSAPLLLLGPSGGLAVVVGWIREGREMSAMSRGGEVGFEHGGEGRTVGLSPVGVVRGHASVVSGLSGSGLGLLSLGGRLGSVLRGRGGGLGGGSLGGLGLLLTLVERRVRVVETRLRDQRQNTVSTRSQTKLGVMFAGLTRSCP